jgi:hypothetical protein
VREDLLDHLTLGDDRQQAQPTAAPRAGENIDRESPPQKIRPGEVPGPQVADANRRSTGSGGGGA